MFIPPQHINRPGTDKTDNSDLVLLRSSHVVIGANLVRQFFDAHFNVDVVYYPNQRALYVASEQAEDFNALHKTKPYMLKATSLSGAKSIGIRDLLIDHEIDTSDRELLFTWDAMMGVLRIIV